MASTVLVLGTAQLTRPYGLADSGRRRDPATVLDAATTGGAMAIDTAPAYGDAEFVIGAHGSGLPVFTKLDLALDPARSIERSRQRLRRPRVDGAFLHDPAVVGNDADDVIGRAARLVGGSIGFLGASLYTPDELRSALDDERISAVQVPVSVADQRLVNEGLLDDAAARGLEVYVRSALLQGALLLDRERLPRHLGALAPIIDVVQASASELGVSPLDVVLGFVRDLPAVTGVVVGAEDARQVENSLAALRADALPHSIRDALADVPVPAIDVVDPRRWPPA